MEELNQKIATLLSEAEQAKLNQIQAEINGTEEWKTNNMELMITLLDSLVALSIPLLNELIVDNIKTIYEIKLKITDDNMISQLTELLSCPQCKKILMVVSEYNSRHIGNKITLGGIRKDIDDQYLIYFNIAS